MTRSFNSWKLVCPFFGFAALCAVPQQVLAQQTLGPQKEFFIGSGQVDLYRGTFLYSHTDISVGPPDSQGGLELARFHGVRENVGAFGYGAAHSLDIFVERKRFLEDNNVAPHHSSRYTVTIGRNTEVFVHSYGTTAITYESGSGGYQAFSETSPTGPYTYYGPDGVVITFGTLYDNAAGATSLTKADGTRLDFTSQSGFSLVSNNFGYGLGFEWGSKGITKVCALNLAIDAVSGTCPTGTPAATYTYATVPSNSTTLGSYTDPTGQTTTFGSNAGTLNSITLPGNSTPNVSIAFYPLSGKVSTQTFSDGTVWTYHYETENLQWYQTPENGWTEVTNGAGKITHYEFLGAGGSKPSKVRDELGRETNFGYTWAGGGLQSVPLQTTLPEGNYTHYSYTGGWGQPTEVRQVAKAGSGLADIVTTATYPTCTNSKLCDKPLTTTDARGATTNYSYDSAHGGILSELKPAPTSGAPRPLKLTSWTQRYAYIKDSGGSLVQASTPVWVVTSVTECQTVAGGNTAVCDTSAPVTVTAIEYPSGAVPNALLPAGKTVSTGGVTRRTCFGYDTLGRTISQTSPNAALTSCP